MPNDFYQSTTNYPEGKAAVNYIYVRPNSRETAFVLKTNHRYSDTQPSIAYTCLKQATRRMTDQKLEKVHSQMIEARQLGTLGIVAHSSARIGQISRLPHSWWLFSRHPRHPRHLVVATYYRAITVLYSVARARVAVSQCTVTRSSCSAYR
jgi:hypothetical protein